MSDLTSMERRALEQVKEFGRKGKLVDIGWESRTEMELVERGLLWQEIAAGRGVPKYKFTLSPSGDRAIEQGDGA